MMSKTHAVRRALRKMLHDNSRGILEEHCGGEEDCFDSAKQCISDLNVYCAIVSYVIYRKLVQTCNMSFNMFAEKKENP